MNKKTLPFWHTQYPAFAQVSANPKMHQSDRRAENQFLDQVEGGSEMRSGTTNLDAALASSRSGQLRTGLL